MSDCNRIIVILCLYLVSWFGTSAQEMYGNEECTHIVTITDIEKDGKYYYITAEDTIIYVIVSHCSNKIKNADRIKKGKTYQLKIKAYFNESYLPMLGLRVQIKLGDDVIYVPLRGTIVTASNLQGLYILNSSN